MKAIGLTALTEKAAAYETDRWFQQGLATASAHLREADLWRLATITAKAEAVSTRQLGITLDFLRDNGFAVVAARQIGFDAGNVHQLWMYHWNVATPDRRALAQDLLSMGTALFLAVVDRADPCRVPGSVRLSALKGSAYPSRRLPDQLRSLLGAQGRMLTFVHTTDEPADVVREMGLLFSDGEREKLVREIADGGDADGDATASAQALYARYPERSMDPGAAYQAMRGALEETAKAEDEKGAAAEVAISILDADRARPGALPWRRLKSYILAARPDLDLWDPVLHATERVMHDQPGIQPDLRDGTAEDWMALENLEKTGAP